MKFYELFIDELGHSNPLSTQSDLYILCGCVVENSDRENIKIKADQIKFKYWNTTDVVFHSRELGRNLNDFKIFDRKTKFKEAFYNDLFCLLRSCNFSIFVITVNKKLTKGKGWNSVKVIQETSRKLLYHFIVWLLGMGGAKGKINVESATAEKDKFYLNQFSYFLSPGCKELSVDFKTIQNILTSISFVTKRNHDIEEQIADLFAYAARCKFMRQNKIKTFKVGSYEDRMIKLLDNKLFQKPLKAREQKMKFYESIEPFCILPKT